MIMVRTLDKTRHYGTVYGMPPITYEQDGFHFLGNGMLAPPDEPDPRKDSPEGAPPLDLATGVSEGSPQRQLTGDRPSDTNVDIPQTDADYSRQLPAVKPDDMRLAVNKAVKHQWEAYHDGEEWPGLAEARRILQMGE